MRIPFLSPVAALVAASCLVSGAASAAPLGPSAAPAVSSHVQLVNDDDVGLALGLGALGIFAGIAAADRYNDRYYHYNAPRYYYEPRHYYAPAPRYYRPRAYYHPRAYYRDHYYSHRPRVHYRYRHW